MLQTTLGIIIKDGKMLLGEKKRGFAKGVLNGVGGKIEKNETLEECLIRESKEEIGIDVISLEKIGEMNFYFNEKPDWGQVVNLYMINDYSGEVIETDEIKPFWFDLNKLPYDKMWKDDSIWMPRILAGEKGIKYNFWFDKDNGDILKYEEIK